MEATAERPMRVVNHATNAFKAPEEQPTARELEAEMMAALMQPPSMGQEDQAGEDDQQGSGEKNEQKQQGKNDKSKQGDKGEQNKQEGQQDQQQQGQQQESQDGQSGKGGESDQSADCQLEPEDREGLPDTDASKFEQNMIEKMLESLLLGGDKQEDGEGESQDGDGQNSEGDGKPTGEAEHESFDNEFKNVGSEARVLASKKGEKVETILTNAQAVDHLRVTTNNFGRNLYAKYRQFGKLTAEQMFWAHKIAMESIHPAYKPTLI